MTRNTWIIFTLIVVVLFGGLIYLSTKNRIDVSNVDAYKILDKTEQSGNIADHSFGNPENKVVLIEYGDYQCPGCGSAYQPIKTVTEKYKDKLTFVFRNYPLTSMHPNAKAAAAAAEAAGQLGKYWEMHDVLYEKQSEWQSASSTQRNDYFTTYAASVGLDRAKFTKKLSEAIDQINAKISFDQALGQKVGVDGTPTFFLNGKKINQKVLDGKLVDANSKQGNEVWGDAEAFDTLIIQPALKEAGLLKEETSKDKK
ncbi:MAG TPA: DsbA family protein [Candidatus Saccharimonadales bacterium]